MSSHAPKARRLDPQTYQQLTSDPRAHQSPSESGAQLRLDEGPAFKAAEDFGGFYVDTPQRRATDVRGRTLVPSAPRADALSHRAYK